jgi:hypothetical protein
MNDSSIAPVLPKVIHFIVGRAHRIDPLTLCVWILLTPNLQILDISILNTFDKIELAKELSDMIDNDQRLKPSFEHINQLIIFPQSDDTCEETKVALLSSFQQIFIKAVIQ